jgi:hypothetical protein
MPILNKTFHFKQDTENWLFRCDGPGFAKSHWKAPRPTGRPYSGLGFDFVALGGGSLSSSVANGSGGDYTNNYWEWSGRWSDLGIPTGAKIISVDAAYSYRWMCSGSRTGSSFVQRKVSSIVLNEGDAKTGPFELRDNSGSLIGTFSPAVDCPARSGWTDWGKWPLPYQDNPIQEVPTTWSQPTHTQISIPSAYQADSSSIKLRLNNLLPQAPNNDPGTDSYYYIALKNDDIVLTIEYAIWGKRVKPTTNYTDRTKPTSIWSNRTEPITSFTKRTKPNSIWTDRIKPALTDYALRLQYLLWNDDGYLLQEDGGLIILEGTDQTSYADRSKPITAYNNRSKPTNSFTNRSKPSTPYTNRIKPSTSFSSRTKPNTTWTN